MHRENFFSLERIIERQPLTVVPETPVIEVIKLMQKWGNSCSLSNNENNSEASSTIPINNSCAFVAINSQLQGIFTERDLVKIITVIRQNLQPINLMKWRRVQEIMTTHVIHAPSNISIRHAAKLMAEHQVSYLVIAQEKGTRDGLLIPIGIITERDIVQFQALNLDLAQPVQRLMINLAFMSMRFNIYYVSLCLFYADRQLSLHF